MRDVEVAGEEDAKIVSCCERDGPIVHLIAAEAGDGVEAGAKLVGGLNDVGGSVRGACIDDDHLEIRVVLPDERLERLVEPLGAVVGGDDDSESKIGLFAPLPLHLIKPGPKGFFGF